MNSFMNLKIFQFICNRNHGLLYISKVGHVAIYIDELAEYLAKRLHGNMVVIKSREK